MPIELWQGLLIPFAGTTLVRPASFLCETIWVRWYSVRSPALRRGSWWRLPSGACCCPQWSRPADMGRWSFVPAVAGFWLGILFLLGTGSADSASAPRQRGGRGHQKQSWKNNHADLGCGAAQYSGRNGGGRGLRRVALRRQRYHAGGGRWPFHWGSPFRTSRRRNHFHAPESGGILQIPFLSVRNAFRCSGAHRCDSDHPFWRGFWFRYCLTP